VNSVVNILRRYCISCSSDVLCVKNIMCVLSWCFANFQSFIRLDMSEYQEKHEVFMDKDCCFMLGFSQVLVISYQCFDTVGWA